MEDADSRTKFELLLIELEYTFFDFEYERECEANLGYVANVAQLRSKRAAARYAFELGLNLLLDSGRGATEVVPDRR